MENKKINFIANRRWLTKESEFRPQPIMKTIPEWYRKADRFFKNLETGEYAVGPDKGKIPTWKACPSMFDIMGSGYTYLIPCDINFVYDKNNKLIVEVEDSNYKDFCTPRSSLPGFVKPSGYYDDHFAWFPDWGVQVPKGYSVLYSHPFNRFELPFLTISGIIDNDKIALPGFMPFLMTKGFSGIIPKGTPYSQMIPFKREDWDSEFEVSTFSKMILNNKKNGDKYRKPDGGIYKNEVWEPRRYK